MTTTVHPANDPVFVRIPADTRELIVELWNLGREDEAEAILNEFAALEEKKPEVEPVNWTVEQNRIRHEQQRLDRVARARARSGGQTAPPNTTGASPSFLHKANAADAPQR